MHLPSISRFLQAEKVITRAAFTNLHPINRLCLNILNGQNLIVVFVFQKIPSHIIMTFCNLRVIDFQKCLSFVWDTFERVIVYDPRQVAVPPHAGETFATDWIMYVGVTYTFCGLQLWQPRKLNIWVQSWHAGVV